MSAQKQEQPAVEPGTTRMAIMFVLCIALVIIISLGAIVLLPYDKNAVYTANTPTNTAFGGWLAFDKTATYVAGESGLVEVSRPDLRISETGMQSYMALNGDQLFYIRDGGLWAVSLILRAERQLVEDAQSFQLMGNWVFYADRTGALHKMRQDGSRQTALQVTVAGQWFPVGGSIYYVGGDRKIWSCLSDGTGKKMVLDTQVDTFSIEGSLLLYLAGGQLYSRLMNVVDGEVVLQGTASQYAVLGNDIALINEHGLQVIHTEVIENADSSGSEASSKTASEAASGTQSAGYEADENSGGSGDGAAKRRRLETLKAGVRPDGIQADGQFFYFHTADNKLCRIKPDGTEYKEFANVPLHPPV